MFLGKFIKKVSASLSILLILSMILSGCSELFPTQRMIDDILPFNDKHYYCDADLIPYSKDELKNATILYGQDLSEYYFLNLNKYDENVTDVDQAAKEVFMARLTYMNSNYKLLKDRYEKYAKEEGNSEEDFKKVDQEFNDFYKLPDSKIADVVKENNNGKLTGSPKLSLCIDVNTLNKDGIYYEGVADIYEHVTLDKKSYNKMKIGDKITLELPEELGSKENTNVKNVELTLIATDSFIEYDGNKEKLEKETASFSNAMNRSKDNIYYVTPDDPLSQYRSLIDANGKVIETYRDSEVVQILKDARFAQGIDETRLVTQILRGDFGTKNFSINEIFDASKGGGYIDEIYKEKIYVNTIYTNLKGYITSGYEYKQMFIDNDYARKNNTKYQDNESVTNNENNTPDMEDFPDFVDDVNDDMPEELREAIQDDMENVNSESNGITDNNLISE